MTIATTNPNPQDQIEETLQRGADTQDIYILENTQPKKENPTHGNKTLPKEQPATSPNNTLKTPHHTSPTPT